MRAVELSTALPTSQADRRRRVVAAAMSLGSEGGYEAIQMRDVASRAGVAMGTVYRYFSSKDHLLAAAMVDWAEELVERISSDLPGGTTPADRVAAALALAASAMGERLKLVGAMVAALSSSDPGVVPCQGRVSAAMERLVTEAAGDPVPEEIGAVSRVLSYVLYAELIGWVGERHDVSHVIGELSVATRLLLHGGK